MPKEIGDGNYLRLTGCLFVYFQHNLPVDTPMSEIGELAKLAATEVKTLLNRHKREEGLHENT